MTAEKKGGGGKTLKTKRYGSVRRCKPARRSKTKDIAKEIAYNQIRYPTWPHGGSTRDRPRCDQRSGGETFMGVGAYNKRNAEP